MSGLRRRYNLDLARQAVYPPRSDVAERRRPASLLLAWSTTSVCTLKRTPVLDSFESRQRKVHALSSPDV